MINFNNLFRYSHIAIRLSNNKLDLLFKSKTTIGYCK